MNQFLKRSFAVIMVAVMILCALPAVTITSSAASYTYNWGSRGTVADETDFARSTAEEWYADNGASYGELSALSGSASTSSVPSSALFTSLRSLMRGAVTNTTSYDGTRDLFKYTDCENNGDVISSFYSGKEIGPDWDSGATWNREHVWPNSKGNANGSGENDIFMLRPTSVSENSSRGNTAYGESGSYYHPNSESDGQYDLRGDVARIILFVYVRWQDTSSSSAVLFGSSGVMESKEVLLKWMEEDPVDTWELGRNDSCQSITGTRNVFVDYPELAFTLFNEDVPTGYTSPSGGASSAYTVTATSNNTSYGTVSVSGSTITATPKTGYYASGYTVTSGTATVTQDGNTFKVSASSDCTIRINFAAKTTHTVTYMAAGSTYSSSTAYSEDVITIDSYTGTVPEGFTFKGWVTGTVEDTTEKPATVYSAGDSYTVTANATFYALFTYTEGGSGATEYVLTDIVDISSADSVVVTMTYTDGTVYALYNANGTSKAPTATIVTVADNKLSEEPDATLLWNIGGDASGYIFYPEGTTDTWLYCISDNNGVRVGTNSANTFTIDASSGYLKHTGTNRYVGVYRTNPDWRCYTNTTGNTANQTLGFYVKGEGGVTYYTTNPVKCEHSNTSNIDAVAATCTETGYTAGVYCNDCATYVSGHEVVDALEHSYNAGVVTNDPTCTVAGVKTFTCSRCGDTYTEAVAATGHSYSGVVTAPTVTEQGYTTYTCSVCGDSYVSDYVEALGETYIVSFSVPAGVEVVAQMECGKNGIALPSAGVPTGDYEYTFVGWLEEELEDTTDKPTVYKADETYTATAATTLYAVYSYAVEDGNGTSNEYALYSGTLTEGDYVIVYNTSAMVAADTDSSGRMDYTTVTVSNDSIQNPDATIVWHIAPEGEYWTIYNAENAVYAAGTGAKNKSTVISSVTDYGKWTATGDGSYEFENLGNTNKGVNALLRCNGTYGFACYSTLTGGALSLYKATAGASIYYTTLNAAECGHTNTNTETVDATCTEAGSVTVTCADCGEVISTEEIAALGHCYGDWITVTPPTYQANGSKTKTCSACGDVVTEDIAKLANPVTQYNVSLKENIGVNFVMNLAETDVVTVNGVEVTAVDGVVSIDLAAAQMCDEITITVNGLPLEKTYSVKGYADAILADSSQSEYHNLVKAMLVYGAASQNYFGYNTDNLASADVSTAVVPETTTDIALSDNIDGLDFYGASLSYRNKIAVRFYFTADLSNYTVAVDGYTYTTGQNYVEIAGILPQELGNQITVTVTDAAGNVISVSYGPMNYIVRMNVKGSDTAKALVQALYGYYLAAEAYTAAV